MFFLPFTIAFVFLLILLLPLLFLFVKIGIISIAFENLGISGNLALLFYLLSLMLSSINIPIYKREVVPPRIVEEDYILALFGSPPEIYREQIIAINLGGGLLPAVFAIILAFKSPVIPFIITLLVVTTVSYIYSKPVPGIGIIMPFWISPLASAVTASLFTQNSPAAPVAFSAGVLGTILGADILRLKDFALKNPGILSIGGAGVFDGIFLTGIIAAFLS